MQNKKLIALIILSVCAVISLVYGMVAPTRSKGRQPISSKPSRDKPVKIAETGFFAKRDAKKSNYATWGRNPFIPKEVVIKKIPKFILNGIVFDEKGPRAVINDEIVGIGDKIGKNTIVDIRRDSVILNDGISDIELRLEE
jgi:hypothetical protein